jgi:hypothetical protein
MEDCIRDQRLTDRFIVAKNVKAAGWGLFSIWMGIAMFAHVGAGATWVGIGIIILGAQAVLKHAALKIDAFWVAAGFLIVAAGIWELLNVKLDLLPFLCVAAGAAFLISIAANGHWRQS